MPGGCQPSDWAVADACRLAGGGCKAGSREGPGAGNRRFAGEHLLAKDTDYTTCPTVMPLLCMHRSALFVLQLSKCLRAAEQAALVLASYIIGACWTAVCLEVELSNNRQSVTNNSTYLCGCFCCLQCTQKLRMQTVGPTAAAIMQQHSRNGPGTGTASSTIGTARTGTAGTAVRTTGMHHMGGTVATAVTLDLPAGLDQVQPMSGQGPHPTLAALASPAAAPAARSAAGPAALLLAAAAPVRHSSGLLRLLVTAQLLLPLPQQQQVLLHWQRLQQSDRTLLGVPSL